MIVHFDLDAFYASVAQRDDPALRGVPLAISGSSRRAVVLTASYEARPFGVRSAMPLYRARELCPQLVVVPPNFVAYRETSRRVFAIFVGHEYRRSLIVEGYRKVRAVNGHKKTANASAAFNTYFKSRTIRRLPSNP